MGDPPSECAHSEQSQQREPRRGCLPHMCSSRLSELVGLFTKLQKGSSAANEDCQRARRRKHFLGPGSIGKVKRLASDVEDREKQLQAKQNSRNLERSSTSGKAWILPEVLASRELLRWELRRVCCGGIPILPSLVQQQVKQWTSDNGRVDVARLRHSKMSWKVEMLEKIDVQRFVETLEGGELSPHLSTGDSRYCASSPDSEFCQGYYMNPPHSPAESRNSGNSHIFPCPSRLNVDDWNLPEFNYYYNLHQSQLPHSLCNYKSGRMHELLLGMQIVANEAERISHGVRLRGRVSKPYSYKTNPELEEFQTASSEMLLSDDQHFTTADSDLPLIIDEEIFGITHSSTLSTIQYSFTATEEFRPSTLSPEHWVPAIPLLTDSDDEHDDPTEDWFSLSQDFDESSLSDGFFSCTEDQLAELPPPAPLSKCWQSDTDLGFGVEMEPPIGYEGGFSRHCYDQVPSVLKDEFMFGQDRQRCFRDSKKLKSWNTKFGEQDQNPRSVDLPFMLWSENENSIWGTCDPRQEALKCDMHSMEPIRPYISNRSISDKDEVHADDLQSCMLCQRRYTEGDYMKYKWTAKPKLQGNNQGWECHKIKN